MGKFQVTKVGVWVYILGMAKLEAFNLILFGMTSNLAQLKLIPALYSLEENNWLAEGTRMWGIARRDWDREAFSSFIRRVLQESKAIVVSEEVAGRLIARMSYIQGDFGDNQVYEQLQTIRGNKLLYLATYPDLYGEIFEGLAKSGLNKQEKGWSRLMIEKPIGRDLTTALALDRQLHEYFQESQIYRLDHYLGKETLQNILAFRFGNVFIQSLMSNEFVDHVQITAAEEFGIGQRAGYYDTMGALLDVGQNHLLQMLVVAMMEAPVKFGNDEVTRARVKVLESLKTFPDSLVLGQYNGYLYEDQVAADSKTDTFFAFKTEIDNERWRGVPIYVRGGKKLSRSVSEVAIVFRKPQDLVFGSYEMAQKPNVLTYRIQPNEGIGMEMLFKKPGHKFDVGRDYLQFCYKPGDKPMDAYVKLLFDAISGDATFFNDSPEVMAAWKFVDGLRNNTPRLEVYDPGSWGPEASDRLLARDGREWIEPSEALCRI